MAGSRSPLVSARTLLALVALSVLLLLAVPSPAAAITAPELRGQRALQDLSPDMHGRNLRQQEAELEGSEGLPA